MKNAILLHGKPSKKEYYDPNVPALGNAHWFPWLQKQLLIRDIFAVTPEIPNSWKPDYPTWKKEFERFDIIPDTILVGHSCGGGFLVRYLSEAKDLKVGRVVLVAPWLDPNREEGTGDFFDFTIDPELTNRTVSLTIFDSDDDHSSVHESVRIIRETVKNIKYRQFHNYGHFCLRDMKTEQFPELLNEVIDSGSNGS